MQLYANYPLIYLPPGNMVLRYSILSMFITELSPFNTCIISDWINRLVNSYNRLRYNFKSPISLQYLIAW